jgi:glutamate N-acetyltransferase/amino-acid N-acetyltransferase
MSPPTRRFRGGAAIAARPFHADDLQRGDGRQRHLDLRHAARLRDRSGPADGAPAIADPDDPRLADFAAAFGECLHELALMIVKDGEGATKLVRVEVTGAVSDDSAKRIAMSIANSPLVKTAVTGEDANWGRVVMAVGKAGEPADRDRLAIWFGDMLVASEGERPTTIPRRQASAYMTE